MKYFIVSDVHSFYFEMISSLIRAGYSKNDESHVLIVNGDLFDRGPNAIKMYEFIREIPKERRILIRGNHEQLVTDVVEKEKPHKNDISNGTVDTILQLAGESKSIIKLFFEEEFVFGIEEDLDRYSLMLRKWKKIIKHSKVKEVVEWIKSDEWIDFYEIDNFILAHCFIPLKIKDFDKTREDLTYNDVYEYRSDWRNASKEEWLDARWGNPWALYMSGLFAEEENQGKTLVVGHWSTHDFYWYLNKYRGQDIRDIYFSEGIIGLDGGVRKVKGVYKYHCNVFVIDNDIYTCYDEFGERVYTKEKDTENE